LRPDLGSPVAEVEESLSDQFRRDIGLDIDLESHPHYASREATNCN
jgi:hypothetical protein